MIVKTLHPILLGIAAMSFVGCLDPDPPRSPAKTSISPSMSPIQVAFLGDQTRVELLSEVAAASGVSADDSTDGMDVVATIQNRPVTMRTARSDNVAAHVSACSVADLVVIAVDARKGPMPVHREHIFFAGQMRIPAILIAFTHSIAIDDPELLELEELEMRELLDLCGWNGDEAIVAFDSDRARVEHAAGAVMGARALSNCFSSAAQRSQTPPEVVSSGCSAEIYALAEVQAFPLQTTGLSSGEFTVVLGGSMPKVQVHPTRTIDPGESGHATLAFDPPASVHIGQRFAILVADHVAAVGVITGME
jgi:hypothetical protein